MAWVALTQQAVKARMSNKESTLFVAAAEHAQDFDMLDEIIAQVTALVRSKVATCPANASAMGPDGTIPSECIHAAATIAKSSLCAAFPISEGETDLRKTELANANTFLDSVASCQVTIAGVGGSIPGSGNTVIYGGDKLMDFHL